MNPERTCHCNSLSDVTNCSSVIHPVALIWERKGGAVKPGHFFYVSQDDVIVRVLQEWEGDSAVRARRPA